MPSKIKIQTANKKVKKHGERPEFNTNVGSTYVKRSEEEYKAELAKMKQAKATMPRFSSPNRAAASTSPARQVKSKNLGNGAHYAIKVFEEKQEEKRDSSVESFTPTGQYGAYYNAAKNLR